MSESSLRILECSKSNLRGCPFSGTLRNSSFFVSEKVINHLIKFTSDHRRSQISCCRAPVLKAKTTTKYRLVFPESLHALSKRSLFVAVSPCLPMEHDC